MDDLTRNMIDKFKREDVYMSGSSGDFPADSKGDKLKIRSTALTAQVETAAAEQASEGDSLAQAFAQLENARNALIEDLEILNYSARLIADDVEGIEEKFRRPYKLSDEILLAKARAALADLPEFQIMLMEDGELPADYTTDLEADINAFEAARVAASSALEMRGAARATLADLVRQRMNLSRQITAFVKLKYRDNPGKRAAWEIASHLERPPRRRKQNSGGTPPPTE